MKNMLYEDSKSGKNHVEIDGVFLSLSFMMAENFWRVIGWTCDKTKRGAAVIKMRIRVEEHSLVAPHCDVGPQQSHKMETQMGSGTIEDARGIRQLRSGLGRKSGVTK